MTGPQAWFHNKFEVLSPRREKLVQKRAPPEIVMARQYRAQLISASKSQTPSVSTWQVRRLAGKCRAISWAPAHSLVVIEVRDRAATAVLTKMPCSGTATSGYFNAMQCPKRPVSARSRRSLIS